MAVILVTYDLRKPGRDYAPVHRYLRQFTHCKEMESVWLLDTTTSCETIRDELQKCVDDNDILFVVRLRKEWASRHYDCASWLKEPGRSW